MNITPAEIREKKFRSKVMGYSAAEVEAFISMVADQVEGLQKEVNTLREHVRNLNTELEMHKGREESVKKIMMTAQKICEDMKKNAEKECQVMLSEAELRAEKLQAEANQRLVDITNEIAEMKRQKIRFEESLRSLLTTHFKLLDISKEDKGLPG